MNIRLFCTGPIELSQVVKREVDRIGPEVCDDSNKYEKGFFARTGNNDQLDTHKLGIALVLYH